MCVCVGGGGLPPGTMLPFVIYSQRVQYNVNLAENCHGLTNWLYLLCGAFDRVCDTLPKNRLTKGHLAVTLKKGHFAECDNKPKYCRNLAKKPRKC